MRAPAAGAALLGFLALRLWPNIVTGHRLGLAYVGLALIGGLLSLVVLGVAGAARARARRGGGQAGSIRDAMQVELPYGPSMILGAWIAICLVGLGAFPVPT